MKNNKMVILNGPSQAGKEEIAAYEEEFGTTKSRPPASARSASKGAGRSDRPVAGIESATGGTSMYAVIQQGGAVFGVGNTIEEALTDAAEWSDDTIELGQEGVVDDMVLKRVTPRLAEAVIRDGGQVEYVELTDGTLDLEME
jgi:hypothetical protein